MRLDKISRRRFLKGAGAAALAVAAAGMLAGCDGNSNNGNPILSKEVTVTFILDDDKTTPIGDPVKVTVGKDAKTVPANKLPIPEGYVLAMSGEEFPLDENDCVTIYIKGTKELFDNAQVHFYGQGLDVTYVIQVKKGAKTVPHQTLVDLLSQHEGYELVNEGDADIGLGGIALVIVKKA